MSGSGDGSDEDVVNEDVLGFGLSRWGAGGDEKWLSGKVAQAYLRDRFRIHPCPSLSYSNRLHDRRLLPVGGVSELGRLALF